MDRCQSRVLRPSLALLVLAILLVGGCSPPTIETSTGVGCRASTGIGFSPQGTKKLLPEVQDLYGLSLGTVHLMAYQEGELSRVPLKKLGLQLVPPAFSFQGKDEYRTRVALLLRSIDCRFVNTEQLLRRLSDDGIIQSWGAPGAGTMELTVDDWRRHAEDLERVLEKEGLIQLSPLRPTAPQSKTACDAQDKFIDQSSAEEILAHEAWARVQSTGTGTLVGILDTGVDYKHPLMNAVVEDRLCAGEQCEGCSGSGCAPSASSPDPGRGENGTPSTKCGEPGTDCRHGTSSVSVVAGACSGGLGSCADTESCVPSTKNASGSPGPAVAPAAGVLDLRAIGGFDGDDPVVTNFSMLVSLVMVAAAVDLDPQLKSKLSAVVISQGFEDYEFTDTQSCLDAFPCLGRAIELLRRRDIGVVVSSGNNGTPDKVMAPACLPGAIAVGGLTAGMEQMGNGGALVDFLAPADQVWAASSSVSLPECCDTTHVGTSVAAPAVAGALALARAAGEDDLEAAVQGLCVGGFGPMLGTNGGLAEVPWPRPSPSGSALHTTSKYWRPPRTTCPSIKSVSYTAPRQLSLDCYPLAPP